MILLVCGFDDRVLWLQVALAVRYVDKAVKKRVILCVANIYIDFLNEHPLRPRSLEKTRVD